MSLVVRVLRGTCSVLNELLQVFFFAQELDESLILLLALGNGLLIGEKLIQARSLTWRLLLIQNVVDFLLSKAESRQKVSIEKSLFTMFSN